MKKIFAALFALLLVGAGCAGAVTPQAEVDSTDMTVTPPAVNEASWKIYQTEAYAISYPENFVITPKDTLLWTTIKSSEDSTYNGSIEIWSKKDLPERPLGYGGAENDIILPIFEGEVGIGQENKQQVRIWNYSGDAETAKILMEILATMDVK